MKTNQEVEGSLLLDLPVVLRLRDGVLHVESQAHQGLFRWLDNFKTISVCSPVAPDNHVQPTWDWVPADTLLETGRLTIYPLPWGYHPRQHLKEVGGVRRLYRKLIPNHQYLQFSNLGWFGAWGRIGAEEAHRIGKPYSVWLDWVIHEMPIRREGSALKRIWRRVDFELNKWGSLRDVKRAGLGLFHGMTVYQSYAPYSAVPKIVHDIHLGEADVLKEPALEARLTADKGRVSIVYVGRVHEMKGPRQWLDTVEKVVRTAGSDRVEATWFGDGPMIEEMRALVVTRGLGASVSFPGNLSDRGRVLEAYRSADLFVFCHLTPESPRCLIEALMSGLPILGIESAYASDLTSAHSGSPTVPTGDVAALDDVVTSFVHDKDRRAGCSRAALLSGKQFSEESVFRHRSELIKEFLSA
jgi:glycosyltransferase involved in cell wall biosynthesis